MESRQAHIPLSFEARLSTETERHANPATEAFEASEHKRTEKKLSGAALCERNRCVCVHAKHRRHFAIDSVTKLAFFP